MVREVSIFNSVKSPHFRTGVRKNGPAEYEIVDGWGRLLPFVVLLQQGFLFYPVEIFVAYTE